MEVEETAREIIGNPTEHPAGYLVVIDTAPEQTEIEFAPPRTLRNSIIIEALAELVELAYRSSAIRMSQRS